MCMLFLHFTIDYQINQYFNIILFYYLYHYVFYHNNINYTLHLYIHNYFYLLIFYVMNLKLISLVKECYKFLFFKY